VASFFFATTKGEAMRLDKLTLKGQEALQSAQHLAETMESPQIEPEHLLDSLIAQDDGIVNPLLKKLGAPPEVLHS